MKEKAPEAKPSALEPLLLNSGQAAKVLGISVRYLYTLRKSGKIVGKEPVVTKISDDHYVVVYHRDIPLSIAFAESIKTTNRLLSDGLKATEEDQSRNGYPIAVELRATNVMRMF